MDALEVLERSYARTLQISDQVTFDDLDRHTPCEGWTVRELLGHFAASIVGTAEMARGRRPDFDDIDILEPAEQMSEAVAYALDIWRQDHVVDTPSTFLEGLKSSDFACADALAHTWDLAISMGIEPQLDPASVAYVWARWSGGAADNGRTFGAFGPAVAIEADASIEDKLIALFGRTPNHVVR